MKNLISWSLGLLLFFQISCSSSSKEVAPIRVRLAQDPESLHPLNYGNAISLQILGVIFQSLLTADLKDKSIRPSLATALPKVRTQDSLTFFTYHLRPEARWDDGTPITAKDVALSLKLIHSPQLDNEKMRAQYDFIQDIEYSSKDPLSLTIVCSSYTPEMLFMSGDFFVLPAHKFDPENTLVNISLKTIRNKFDSLSTTPTFTSIAKKLNSPQASRDTSWVKGSGPYKLSSWASGQHVVVKRKEHWWGDKVAGNSPFVARPQEIVYQIIPDNAAAALALKAEQIDVMTEIPLQAFQSMQQDPSQKEKYQFYSPATYDVIFMGMNGFKPMLQSRKTRQALSSLLDVPQIVKNLQGGYATATVGIVHPTEKQFYNSALKPATLNLTRAKQLLEADGWQHTSTGWQKSIGGTNLKLELEIMYKGGNMDFENMALLFQQNAKQLNIPVRLTALESSQVSERLRNKEFDLYFRTLVGNPFSYNMMSLLHTSSAQDGGPNVTNFGTSETDKLLEQISSEDDKTAKVKLLKTLQQKMQEESNMVFLYFTQNRIAISSRLDHVVVSSLSPGYDLMKLSIKK